MSSTIIERDDFVLEARSLSRAFGALRAVDDVNFRLPRGELRAIIGPNGAGKSTFFALLMGRLAPTSGEIFLEGERINLLAPHMISRRGIALAFQITNIFPNLSVADNVRLAVQSRQMSFNPFRDVTSRVATEAAVAGLLEEIVLSGKANEFAANLSHGEQKYLEIGLALAIGPKLLLLDEPTAGMSARETAETAALIKRLSQRVSVILVEHDMDVVMDIADTITVFHQGRILAEGSPDEIRVNDEVQHVYLRGA